MDVGPLSMPSTEPTSVPNLKITSKCDGEINDSQYNMKPAPLYLYEVTDIKALSAELNSVVGENNFTTMPAAKCVIRVQCNDIASYNKLDKYVMEKKLDRHTFQYGFRAFIRHLHHSTPEKWIREKLTNLGHDIIFLRVIKNRYNNQPLNLFEVVLQMKDNNAELFKLGSLGSQIIKVEVPLKVPEVPQCHRCQRLGHTKNYCNRPFVCVKCGENHATTACTRQKNDESPAKCANCLGPHAASYKGCPVYKAAKTNANSAKLNKLITGLTNATPATPATVGRRKPVNKKSTTQPTFKEPLPLAARPQQQQQQRSRSLSIRRTPSWPTLTHSSATNYNNNTQLDQTTLESKLDILIEMASTLVQMLVAARLPIPEAQ
ncbi:hypothetical protein AWZ03_010634 [Drosophila navojoa]|uniref:Pre-C2HC domain-containing protein n=1 Tax=Drosophila navojoa TaxID=7232 RepID=A0A484B2R9_DRONA|nr:hypothetical protein AWZ03_010634 [Drosophila navojoa]